MDQILYLPHGYTKNVRVLPNISERRLIYIPHVSHNCINSRIIFSKRILSFALRSSNKNNIAHFCFYSHSNFYIYEYFTWYLFITNMHICVKWMNAWIVCCRKRYCFYSLKLKWSSTRWLWCIMELNGLNIAKS